MQEEDQFTQYTFQTFLDCLLKHTQCKIILLLDNAKWHHAKHIKSYVDAHHDRLELLFLPPYAPDLNPIERVWRITRKKWTHNRYFPTIFDIMNVLTYQFLTGGARMMN
jgi:transposase